MISHPQGKGPLNALTTAQVQLARRKYWKMLRRVDARAGGPLTIDAMRLPVEALPTIYRLFSWLGPTRVLSGLYPSHFALRNLFVLSS